MRELTQKEVHVLKQLVECWNMFIDLTEIHKNDRVDFKFHIHALQNIVYSRPAVESPVKIETEPTFRTGGTVRGPMANTDNPNRKEHELSPEMIKRLSGY